MSDGREVVAAEGVAPNGDTWTLSYRPDGIGGRHEVALSVNGGEREVGSGFDLPDATEIGFAGGLTPGRGGYYLYGLVTSRIRTVRAQCQEERDDSEVATTPLAGARANDGGPLRSFVLVRPPRDDVIALVGLDHDRRVVQTIPLPG